MEIEFISGFAVITPNPAESRKLYIDALGLPLEGAEPSPTTSTPRAWRAPSTSASGRWRRRRRHASARRLAAETPVPQASVEFEVSDPAAVGAAAAELREAGYDLLHAPARSPGARRSPGCSRQRP